LISDKITEREIEVMQWIAHGRTYEEAGQYLNVSYETVQTHVKKVLRKLEANNKTHAVAILYREGLIV